MICQAIGQVEAETLIRYFHKRRVAGVKRVFIMIEGTNNQANWREVIKLEIAALPTMED
jgi:hypothetical protein